MEAERLRLVPLPEMPVPQLTIDVININDEERRMYLQFSNATCNWFESGRTVLVDGAPFLDVYLAALLRAVEIGERTRKTDLGSADIPVIERTRRAC